jgi:hypothetical protein
MKYPNTLRVLRGESAWAMVVKLRYSPGRARAHVKSLYKKYSKTDSLLILFHDKVKKTIEYRFFLNKELMDPTEEGDLNMFGSFRIDEMKASNPEWPLFIHKVYTFLLSLLPKT